MLGSLVPSDEKRAAYREKSGDLKKKHLKVG
jgi:hypothetical protein